MKKKILIGLIVLIMIAVVFAKSNVTTTTKEAYYSVQPTQILCYQQTKNICVDYKGPHPETCVDSSTINHWWCHENYCIYLPKSCQGGGTNQCVSESDSAKCKFVY
jgi:hypothetical protein